MLTAAAGAAGAFFAYKRWMAYRSVRSRSRGRTNDVPSGAGGRGSEGLLCRGGGLLCSGVHIGDGWTINVPSGVYNKGKKVKGANPEPFKVLGDGWAVDVFGVYYYRGKKMKDAIPGGVDLLRARELRAFRKIGKLIGSENLNSAFPLVAPGGSSTHQMMTSKVALAAGAVGAYFAYKFMKSKEFSQFIPGMSTTFFRESHFPGWSG